jgi:hypothetical protein
MLPVLTVQASQPSPVRAGLGLSQVAQSELGAAVVLRVHVRVRRPSPRWCESAQSRAS